MFTRLQMMLPDYKSYFLVCRAALGDMFLEPLLYLRLLTAELICYFREVAFPFFGETIIPPSADWGGCAFGLASGEGLWWGR
jgi:hypothetical protein